MCSKNSEGYPDPTAYEALKRVTKDERVWKPLVYICSGDSPEAEKEYCRTATENGAIPIAPGLLLMSVDNADTAAFCRKVYLGMCEQLWVFGESITDVMAKEIHRAKKYGKTIRIFPKVTKEN